ncbi:hypothetical protein B5V01_32750 [Mesorhizobium erdmanii]|uniref:Uncharacterized protein n=1 Tax=Mesorhizobium erdmanii TaxID=1777866 RepID=A0A4Q1UHV0_9HYPH|nr:MULTISPECIES: hypothetical protein [Mesorhizobium]RXT34366.1 hypothetical protein B5V01_32750 [Mesorhizobium erdmanii]
MARLPQDKNRIERATRASQSIIARERQAREDKTARLRALRLSSDAPSSAAPAPPKRKAAARKTPRETSRVD